MAWSPPDRLVGGRVVGQRLVRRVCQSCRVRHDPTPRRWPSTESAGREDRFCTGGMQFCSQTGYRERIGVYELRVTAYQEPDRPGPSTRSCAPWRCARGCAPCAPRPSAGARTSHHRRGHAEHLPPVGAGSECPVQVRGTGGRRRDGEGSIDAGTAVGVQAALEERELQVSRSRSTGASCSSRSAGRRSRSRRSCTLRQLAAFTRAGIPILQALQPSPGVRQQDVQAALTRSAMSSAGRSTLTRRGRTGTPFPASTWTC